MNPKSEAIEKIGMLTERLVYLAEVVNEQFGRIKDQKDVEKAQCLSELLLEQLRDAKEYVEDLVNMDRLETGG